MKFHKMSAHDQDSRTGSLLCHRQPWPLTDDCAADDPQVPTLETPEGGIFESNAIARYVARLADTGLFGTTLLDTVGLPLISESGAVLPAVFVSSSACDSFLMSSAMHEPPEARAERLRLLRAGIRGVVDRLQHERGGRAAAVVGAAVLWLHGIRQEGQQSGRTALLHAHSILCMHHFS